LDFALRQSDSRLFQQAGTSSFSRKFVSSAKATFFKTLFAPVDAVAGFEKVLLHEITHTENGQSCSSSGLEITA
jgi:hypothetical protein